MSTKNINTRIALKIDYELNWNDAENFIPMPGEIVIYSKEVDQATGAVIKIKKNGVDTNVVPCAGRTTPYTYDRFKIGDGKTPVYDLPFVLQVDADFLATSDNAQSGKAVAKAIDNAMANSTKIKFVTWEANDL